MDPVTALRGQLRTLPHRLPAPLHAALLALRARAGGPLPPAPELPAVPPTASPRLLVAPTNFAGQGAAWAAAVERLLPGSRAVALEVGAGALAFPADVRVPERVAAGSRAFGERLWNWVLDSFGHVLAESGRPIAGTHLAAEPGRELAVLAAAGLRTAVMAHGTDVRLPSHHAEREPWSPFRERRADGALRELRSRQVLRLFERFEGPRFVSTPDLLPLLPDATWCPVVVDTGRWRAEPRDPAPDRPLRVVHAASNAWIKGSDLVAGTLADLQRDGVIEYRPLLRVPAAEVPAAYRWADVVLDQFRLGSYGVGACEAMATGRVVVGHVADDVRERVRDLTGLELPVQEATPDSLREVLLRLRDPEERATPERTGPAFVAAVHDGTRSARVLADWLRG